MKARWKSPVLWIGMLPHTLITSRPPVAPAVNIIRNSQAQHHHLHRGNSHYEEDRLIVDKIETDYDTTGHIYYAFNRRRVAVVSTQPIQIHHLHSCIESKRVSIQHYLAHLSRLHAKQLHGSGRIPSNKKYLIRIYIHKGFPLAADLAHIPNGCSAHPLLLS